MLRTTATLATVALIATLGTSQIMAATIHDGLQVLYEYENAANLAENNSTVASGNFGTNGSTPVVQDTTGPKFGTGAGDFQTNLQAHMFVSPTDISAVSPGTDGGMTVSWWWKGTDIGQGPPKAENQVFWATWDTATPWMQFPPLPDIHTSLWQADADHTGSRTIRNQTIEDGFVDQINLYDDVEGSPLGPVADGTWHHFALSITTSGGTTKTAQSYLDGSPGDSDSADSNGWGLQRMVLGMQSDDEGDSSMPLEGFLDDFAIWGRTLSDGEILRIYNAGQQGIGLADIPEPSSIVLILAGLAGVGVFGRRRR